MNDSYKVLSPEPSRHVNNVTYFYKNCSQDIAVFQTSSDSLPCEIGIKLPIFVRTFGVRTKTNIRK